MRLDIFRVSIFISKILAHHPSCPPISDWVNSSVQTSCSNQHFSNAVCYFDCREGFQLSIPGKSVSCGCKRDVGCYWTLNGRKLDIGLTQVSCDKIKTWPDLKAGPYFDEMQVSKPRVNLDDFLVDRLPLESESFRNSLVLKSILLNSED